MSSVQNALRILSDRVTVDAALRFELEQALATGGLDAAVQAARRNGVEIPENWQSSDQGLSDLELELVTAGKNVGAAAGMAFGGGIGGAMGMGMGGLLGG